MGVAFYYVRGVLGASFVKWTDSIGLAWFFCEQKAQEGLKRSSLIHLLDGVES